jgi:non-canonical purine NTP pyrophosphatase (RdgB/HAM1 family)
MPNEAASPLASVVLVTGNRGKLAEAQRLCGVELQAANLDLPEIQSLDIGEVLRAKALEAFQLLQKPVVVDETGLELAALGGFPGCLVKWMLEAVGADGIARCAHALADSRATARCALLYFDGEQQVLAEGTTAGTLVLPPRGEGGFGWDSIFQPDGHDLTFAELSGPDKDKLSHRGAAWRQLTDLLRNL